MKLLFLAALVALATHAWSSDDQTKRPNILFILTEDQGAHLSLLGTPGLQTPNMDALAKSGVFFRNAFVGYPVCSPSKACIYTSLHNHTNGILNNTPNYHKPASRLTQAEQNNALYRSNRIHADIPTLVERLHDAGYYQGVMHKLHVAPVEKFPYDEFIPGANGKAVAGFLSRAAKTGKPWHLFFNISVSHRPFPNSETKPIRVKPEEVKLPAFLPDTPLVRQDWCEYLAGLEEADRLVGEGIEALRALGQEKNTIIVCLGGDHGPAFPHGKMTLHDLGLRVTLSINAPGFQSGLMSDALASELDLAPTLLDLAGLDPFPKSHGLSLRSLLSGQPGVKAHDFVFAEISDRGVLPNDGMQERSVCDGRWHLIYRQKLTPMWRQVQADSKDAKPWGNRSYAEIVRVKDLFPEPYRILAEMDPQSLGGKTPPLELYDLEADRDEMHNLATDPRYRPQVDRLFSALRNWSIATQDTSAPLPASP
jgi:N-sulfoglucosamine sulfohydrolase